MVTTNERLQRRQYQLGLFVMFLAICTAVVAIWSNARTQSLAESDKEQQQCFTDSFKSLTETLESRARIAEEMNTLRDQEIELLLEGRTLNNQQINNLVETLIKAFVPDDDEVDTQELITQFLEDTGSFQRQARELEEGIARVQGLIANKFKEQQNNPVPPYPEGKCS